MKKYKKYICTFIIAIMFSLTSCQENVSTPTSLNIDLSPSKMTIGLYMSKSYNPLDIKTNYNEQTNFLIFDSLYNINEKFEAVENLASSLDIENAGRTVNIQIKPNIKFHDKSSLDANDVAATINYIISNGGYYLYNLRNVQNVTVLNDYTLQLNLAYNTPNIQLQLTFPIVSSENLSDKSLNLIGTGPYMIKSENTQKQLLLKKNPDYHNTFDSAVTDIVVELIPDKLTARTLSGSGIVDVFFAAFNDEGLKTITKSQSKKNDYCTDEYTFIGFNYDLPILNIKTFRKALSDIIDREKLQNDTFMSHAQATFLPLFPSSWAYSETIVTKKNIEEGKMLLSQLGYKDTNNDTFLENENSQEDSQLPAKLSFNILSVNTPIKASIINQLTSDFKEIGIELKGVLVDKETFDAKYQNKEYDLCLITTNTGYDLDLTQFIQYGGIFSAPTEYGYNDELLKLSSTPQNDLKKPTYERLCNIFTENMPHIPLVYLKNTLIANDKFKTPDNIYLNNLYYEILRNSNDKKPEKADKKIKMEIGK